MTEANAIIKSKIVKGSAFLLFKDACVNLNQFI